MSAQFPTVHAWEGTLRSCTCWVCVWGGGNGGQSGPVGRNASRAPPQGYMLAVCKRLCKTAVSFYRCISRGSPEISADKETVQWAAHEAIKRQRQGLKPGLLGATTLACTVLSPTYPTSLGLASRGRGNSPEKTVYKSPAPRQVDKLTGGVAGHFVPAGVEMGSKV